MRVITYCFFISLLIFPYISYSNKNPFNGLPPQETFYNVLGVPESSTAAEIKQAVRSMTQKYHPDRVKMHFPEADEKRLEEMRQLYGERTNKILMARDTLLNPTEKAKYDTDLKKYRRSGYQQGDVKSEDAKPGDSTDQTARDFYSYEYFRSSPTSAPFMNPSRPINITDIPNTERVLHLFHLILANDLHFKDIFRGSVSDRKSIEKTKRISEVALKEILRTMGISTMNKQTFQRILSDFYLNFPEEVLRELLKESQNYRPSRKQSPELLENQEQKPSGRPALVTKEANNALGRRDILAEAFLHFITEVKEWYEAQNLKSYERKAIEIFHTLSFLNRDPSELRKSEDRYIELLQKRGSNYLFRRNPLTREEKKELRAFEKQVRQDVRIFRNVLAALGLPKDIHNDMLLRSYLEALKDSLVLSRQGAGSASQQKSTGTGLSVFTNSGQSGGQNLVPANPEGGKGLALRGRGGSSPWGSRAPWIMRKNEHSKSTGSSHARGGPSNIFIHIKDTEVIRVVRNIKITLDDSHYRNLQMMNPLFSKGFLKRFPPMFIALHAAFGAVIYREALTDSILYGAEKNPEMMSEMMTHAITPSAIISLVIFMAVAQKVHYRLYGLGRFMDGKTLKTPFGNVSSNGKTARAFSPAAGIGAGYFAYVIFNDLLNDPNLGPCVKSQFQSEKQHNFQQHIEPCEAFLLTWLESEKWKHYGVDIATIMGASWLSHKFVKRIILSLQPLNLGGLLFRTGKFMTMRTWAGMAIETLVTLYIFLEVHKVLEEWIGKPLKEQLTAGATKDATQNASLYLENELSRMDSLYVDSLNASQLQKTDLEELEHLEFLFTEAKEHIANLGIKFKKWVEVRGRYYNQSVQLWNKQLNKLTLPYSGTLKLLKDIFISSHLKYGLELTEELSPDWDSEEELIKNKETWSELNYESISFSFLSFSKMAESQKEPYCQAIEHSDSFTGWNALCKKNGTNINDLSLVYETAAFILDIMDRFSNRHKTNLYKTKRKIPVKEAKEIFDFRPYISRDLDEMFSSHPNYLVQNLSGKQRFQLSRSLITAGLDWPNILSHFHNTEKYNWRTELCSSWYPNHETDEDIAEIYNLCLKTPEQAEAYCSEQIKQEYPESTPAADTESDPESDRELQHTLCMSFFHHVESVLSQIISLKLLRTGVYVLKKDILNPLVHSHSPLYTNPYEELKRSPHHYAQLLSLANLLEVYKKGERYFTQIEQLLDILKETMDSSAFKEMEQQMSQGSDPHLLTYNLLCKNKRENEEQAFVPPQFLSLSHVSIYDFASKQFVEMQTACNELDRFYFLSREKQKYIHQMLFQRPVQMNNRRYENLYLALESMLRQSYSSSESIEESFQRLSQDQMDDIGGRLSESLNGLTEGYYKELINMDSEISPQSALEEFDAYYNKQRILFDIRSFTGGGIRGLEISLFQIHYWLNILKQILQKGEALQITKIEIDTRTVETPYFTKIDIRTEKETQVTLNEEQLWTQQPFNEKAFEQMRKDVLSLLQSYHNTYQQAQGPYLLIPDGDLIKELNDLFKTEGTEGLKEEYQGTGSRFSILKSEYSSSPLPVFMNSNVILSHILEFSIPNWNNPGQISLFNSNPYIINQPWGELIYSVVFEINSSLKLFFSQMEALYLKEFFDRDIPSSNSTSAFSD